MAVGNGEDEGSKEDARKGGEGDLGLHASLLLVDAGGWGVDSIHRGKDEEDKDHDQVAEVDTAAAPYADRHEDGAEDEDERLGHVPSVVACHDVTRSVLLPWYP